jgi:cytochrome c5
MKKAILFTGLIGGTLLMANCSKKTAGSMASKDNAPEAAVAEVKAKYSEEQMREGMTIWQGSCDKCHKLYEPSSRSVKQWEKILPRMVKRAKLTDEQAGKVRAYLLANTNTMS